MKGPSRLDPSPVCPLFSSEQSEEEGKKKKMKKKKKVPEGQEGGSSSDEGSDSSNSSSESEMTSETEEEQVEPASWRKKTVRTLGQRGGWLMDQPPQPTLWARPRRLLTTQNGSGYSLPHSHPIFLFQPPSSKSAPATKEVSLLDLEDCEFG